MLKPEERVDVTIGMVELVIDISAENEKQRSPRISDDLLISRLRDRLQPKEARHSKQVPMERFSPTSRRRAWRHSTDLGYTIC